MKQVSQVSRALRVHQGVQEGMEMRGHQDHQVLVGTLGLRYSMPHLVHGIHISLMGQNSPPVQKYVQDISLQTNWVNLSLTLPRTKLHFCIQNVQLTRKGEWKCDRTRRTEGRAEPDYSHHHVCVLSGSMRSAHCCRGFTTETCP